MRDRDEAVDVLLNDPQYLLRLYRKVAHSLVYADKVGRKAFLNTFEIIDGRYTARGQLIGDELFLSILRSIFPTTMLMERELRVVKEVLLSDEAGEVGEHRSADPAALCAALRDLVPYPAWQLSSVVNRVRAAAAPGSVAHSLLEQHLRAAPSDTLVQALVKHGGLSYSQTQVLLSACNEPNTAHGHDIEHLRDLLLVTPMPSSVEYSLLAAQFAESTVDATKGEPTGTLALKRALHSLSLSSVDSTAALEAEDLDLGSLVHVKLTAMQFGDLCRKICAGFTPLQEGRLFYFLQRAEKEPRVSVREVLCMHRQHFPVVRCSVLELIEAATAKYLKSKNNTLALVGLHERLRSCGTGRVPLDTYIKALREGGVKCGMSGVTDIELEWLRLRTPTRLRLVLLLCGNMRASREAVVRKLFDHITAGHHDGPLAEDLLAHFQPALIDSVVVRHQAVLWKEALHRYVEEVGSSPMSREVFFYFWQMISAAVDDDPTFTMVIWRCFNMAERRKQLPK